MSARNEEFLWVFRIRPFIGRGLLLFLFFAAIASVSTGCDPGHRIAYDNQTSQTVTVFRDHTRIATLAPSEKKEFSTLEFSGARTFEAREQSGKIIYSEELTWEELKERGWKIVITGTRSPVSSPTPIPEEPA